MKWLITKDHTEPEGSADNRAFKAGNVLGAEAQAAFYGRSDVTPFKLFDDDGELYYEGFAVFVGAECDFAPLDWAMVYAGCTRMDILNRVTNKWETL